MLSQRRYALMRRIVVTRLSIALPCFSKRWCVSNKDRHAPLDSVTQGTPIDEGTSDTRLLERRIRRHAVEMTSRGGSAYVGSVLSMADIIAVLYGRVLRVRSDEPTWVDRDR